MSKLVDSEAWIKFIVASSRIIVASSFCGLAAFSSEGIGFLGILVHNSRTRLDCHGLIIWCTIEFPRETKMLLSGFVGKTSCIA